MSAPRSVANILNCPPEIANARVWLIWRSVQKPGEPKPRKIPYYASGDVRTHAHGSDEDRAALVPFAQAIEAMKLHGATGIGVAFLPGGKFYGVDFDACADAELGVVSPEVLSMLVGIYAEFSPSGKGAHGLVSADSLPGTGNPKSKGLEIFRTAGFMTFTGDRIGDAPLAINAAPEALRAAAAAITGGDRSQNPDDPFAGQEPRSGASIEQIERALASLSPDVGRDEWIRVLMGVHHETGGSAEGFEAVHAWSRKAKRRGAYKGREDVWSQWKSLREQRAGSAIVTFRSVMQMARAAGKGDDKTDQGRRFEVTWGDAFADKPLPEWIVRDMLPDAELAVIYGESRSGKTFAALSMALAIGNGGEWFGRKVVKPGKVLYVAAEGAGGFRKRLRAARMQGHDISRIAVIDGAPSFTDSDDPKVVLERAREVGARVIVIDTLARISTGANENAGEDMGPILERATILARASGCLVILIHHSGKDASRGTRGWSGILGALDAEFEVSRAKTKDGKPGSQRTLRNTKQKDGEDGEEWLFWLRTVVIGQDEEGMDITSCVVEPGVSPTAAAEAVGMPRPLPEDQQALVDIALHLLIGKDAVPLVQVLDRRLDDKGVTTGRAQARGNLKRSFERAISSGSTALVLDGDTVKFA